LSLAEIFTNFVRLTLPAAELLTKLDHEDRCCCCGWTPITLTGGTVDDEEAADSDEPWKSSNTEEPWEDWRRTGVAPKAGANANRRTCKFEEECSSGGEGWMDKWVAVADD
jgi:hypothetical protein